MLWPATVPPKRVDWRLASKTQAFDSPLDGTTQTRELPGAAWMSALTFERLRRAELGELEAFLVGLRGAAGRFDLWHHAREEPRGSNLGTPLVMGGAQTGTTLITDGWDASEAGLLLPGDMFAVNGELKMTMQQVDSDAGGVASLSFEPPLRASPPDDAPITTVQATTTFRLVDDHQVALLYERSHGSFTISCVEAFT